MRWFTGPSSSDYKLRDHPIERCYALGCLDKSPMEIKRFGRGARAFHDAPSFLACLMQSSQNDVLELDKYIKRNTKWGRQSGKA